MKNLVKLVLGFMLVGLVMTACKKEEIAKEIYAPNGVMVSQSMQSLSTSVANGIGIDKNDISLGTISFLEVPKGYIAEIGLHIKSTNTTTKIYYMSSDIAEKMQQDESDIELRRAYLSDSGVTAYCSCSNNSFPSSQCRVSVTINPNGSVTGTCYKEGCSFGCVFHSN